MAGSADPNENPVAINVVPMVDVIFCLCVFFMCCMKFEQIEGKLDSWLPRDKGSSPTTAPAREIRIALWWDTVRLETRRQFGARIVEDDAQLESLIEDAYDDCRLKGQADTPVIIDSDRRVPWGDVVDVVDIAKGLKIARVEFALGATEKQ